MGISRTISEINDDFSRKSKNFPTPCILCPCWREYWELGISTWGQKLEWWMGLSSRERSLTISSAIWIQCTNMTDGRMDREIDTGQQQRQHSCIASCSNKAQNIIQCNKSLNINRRIGTLVVKGLCHTRMTVLAISTNGCSPSLTNIMLTIVFPSALIYSVIHRHAHTWTCRLAFHLTNNFP